MVRKEFSFSKEKADFTLELRKKVKEYFQENKLSKFGNKNLVLKSVLMVFLYLIPFGLMLSGIFTSGYPIILCWVLMGFGLAGLGMVLMHDANHGSYSKSTSVNRLLGNSLYLLGGFPPNWRYQHNTLHHGFTNIEGHDEDISPAGILRFSPHSPLYRIHRYQHWYAWFFYSLMTLSWITAKDFTRLYTYKQENALLGTNKTYTRLFIELIISKLIYFTLFLAVPMLIIPVAWYWILIGFISMHLVAGLTLSIIFQTAHVMPTSDYPLPDDKGIIRNNWAAHQLYTTSDYSPKSRIFSWFIGGLNYQIEHHLFPNVSHIHYRKIALLVQNTAGKYGLPYHVQPNFVTAIYHHFKMLRSLGR
jgi:linoleoyl-CoA desaturase